MASLSLTFPQSLAEKYRPKHIQEFVGLERVKRILSAFVARPYPSAWLFLGPSGVGKTTMAQALAAEIGAEIHHIGSQECKLDVLQGVVRTCWYVPMSGQFHVLICDEADAMTDAAQKYLLSRLDSSESVPATIWVFTANATDRLEPRFLSRCRTLDFSSYGMASDIAGFLDRVWHQEGGNGDVPDFSRIAKESRNNLRDCLMRLETELLAL